MFTVRVPSEKKDVETLKVQVKVPDGAEVSRYEPLPGWKVSLEKDASGKIVSLTWTADQGQGLTAEQFNEFKMSAKVAADAKELNWKAYQTYSDNSVVEWIGAPDADYPASVTMVGAGTGEGDGHGHGDVAADTHAASGSDDAEAHDDSSLPLYLSIACSRPRCHCSHRCICSSRQTLIHRLWAAYPKLSPFSRTDEGFFFI